MADVTKVKASDGTIYDINDVNDYTKDETDALLAGKADVGVSYTKAEDDALLAAKADSSSVDSALALKANVVDVYSKTEADNLLASKANLVDVYSKTEADNLLATKADTGASYTKAEEDALLADKASIDNSSITATMATWSTDKLNVEFQGKSDVGDSYTKAEDDALLATRIGYPDYANVIHSFATGGSGGSDTYVAEADGWLIGCGRGNSVSAVAKLFINGNTNNFLSNDGSGPYFTICIPIKSGDTIVYEYWYHSNVALYGLR